jgi:hypothetical protein
MGKAEGRRQKAEGRRQRAEGRRQRAEGRRSHWLEVNFSTLKLKRCERELGKHGACKSTEMKRNAI